MNDPSLLQYGSAGAVLLVCGYIARIFAKMYADMRKSEQARTQAFVGALESMIADAKAVSATMHSTATTLQLVVAETREALREVKELRREVFHRREES